MTKVKPKYKLVTKYPITNYICGLKAGDRLRLKCDIVVRDYRGKLTGEVHRKGEIWSVLRGAKEKPVVVWLRQPDGKPHTWDDDESIFKTFELIRKTQIRKKRQEKGDRKDRVKWGQTFKNHS